MLSHGAGSELRQPLGYAMVGGLALSQMLTLFTTPVVYLYLDRLQSWLARQASRPRGRRAAHRRAVGHNSGRERSESVLRRGRRVTTRRSRFARPAAPNPP